MKKKRKGDENSEESMDDEEVPEELKPETQPSKRRKAAEKTVVRVRIEVSSGRQKNEGPPSDSWSWRKYGQKPIKGSPYPRGYYRCSTSKGCLAKKQVERCRVDDSILLITYTSSHNHPGPTVATLRQNPPTKEQEEGQQEQSHQEPAYKPGLDRDGFHYLDQAAGDLYSTMNHIFTERETKADTVISSTDNISLVLLDEEEPTPPPQEFPKTEKLEDDFFDELEELLPTISSLKTVEGIWFKDRVPAVSS